MRLGLRTYPVMSEPLGKTVDNQNRRPDTDWQGFRPRAVRPPGCRDAPRERARRRKEGRHARCTRCRVTCRFNDSCMRMPLASVALWGRYATPGHLWGPCGAVGWRGEPHNPITEPADGPSPPPQKLSKTHWNTQDVTIALQTARDGCNEAVSKSGHLHSSLNSLTVLILQYDE